MKGMDRPGRSSSITKFLLNYCGVVKVRECQRLLRGGKKRDASESIKRTRNVGRRFMTLMVQETRLAGRIIKIVQVVRSVWITV
jgi:hypothetical protein